MVVLRSEIWMVQLNPSLGSELKKIRPCVIVSPNEVNKYLNTVTVLPLTSTSKQYPTRVPCVFKNKKGQIAIDQIRTIDKSRLVKKVGVLDRKTILQVANVIENYFAL